MSIPNGRKVGRKSPAEMNALDVKNVNQLIKL
jgi:hypothetical protein